MKSQLRIILPNELMAELCAFIPIERHSASGNKNENEPSNNVSNNVRLLFVSKQLWSNLIQCFRMELSIYGPLLKHIQEIVKSKCCLKLSILAVAPPNNAKSFPAAKSSKKKVAAAVNGIIEKWIEMKRKDYDCAYELRDIGTDFLEWKKRKWDPYFHCRSKKCLLWTDRFGFAVFPHIESNCLQLGPNYPLKQINVYGEWIAHPHLVEFLLMLLHTMGKSSPQYNLCAPKALKPKYVRNEKTGKQEQVVVGRADWLKFLLKLNTLVNTVDISELYRNIDALKAALQDPALNSTDKENDDDGRFNYLRCRANWGWKKETQFLLVQWLMGVHHEEAERKQAKPKKLRIDLPDNEIMDFIDSIKKEFQNATLEGPKFAICLQSNVLLEQDQYEFANVNTNEVLRLLNIEEGYDQHCPKYPVILIVRMGAKEKWPRPEIVTKPPFGGNVWWKFDGMADRLKCNLLVKNPEKSNE